MIRILFRTNETELSVKTCLDTATSVYMSHDNKLIVETAGGTDYVSANEIGQTRFEELLNEGLREGNLNLSSEEFGLFDVYAPSDEPEDIDDIE